MRVTWLAPVLKEAGLVVVERPGWLTRGKEFAGTTLDGVIGHHTASAATSGNMPSVPIVEHGRPDLAGPLAQAVLARDGSWVLTASGVANHAGTGQWPGFTGGNGRTIGIEAENNGLATEVWGRDQMNAYAIGVAAILKHLGLPAERFCAHYEWATNPVGRKVDPRGTWQGGGDWWDNGHQPPQPTWSARQFRARVALLLKVDGMDFTPEEKARLLAGADASVALLARWDASARTKLDNVWTQTVDTAGETLGGRVTKLANGTLPPKGV